MFQKRGCVQIADFSVEVGAEFVIKHTNIVLCFPESGGFFLADQRHGYHCRKKWIGGEYFDCEMVVFIVKKEGKFHSFSVLPGDTITLMGGQMLGIHKNDMFTWCSTFYQMKRCCIEICSLSRFTFIGGRTEKQYRNKYSYRTHWFGSWVYLACELVLLLSFGYLDTDWAGRYWSNKC